MRKLLLSMVVAVLATLLLSTTAFAAPLVNSATERPPEIEIDDPNTPLGELPDDNGSGTGDQDPAGLPDDNGLGTGDQDQGDTLGDVEIDDPSVPLGEIPDGGDKTSDGGVLSPQTGVTGLTGMECATLLAVALAVGGGAMLAKARKQEG